MLGNYNASPKVTAHDEKKEMSNINKESNDMTPPNGSFTDDKNERIRKGLTKIFKEMKKVDHEFEEKMKRRREETMIYFHKSIVY